MRFFILFFVVVSGLCAKEHAVVFIETRSIVSPKILDSIKQIRTFSYATPIYFVTHQKNFCLYKDFFVQNDVFFIGQESLRISEEHKIFRKGFHAPQNCIRFPKEKRFWNEQAEEFFYLAAFLQEHPIKNVFFMKPGNLMYCSFEELLDTISIDKEFGFTNVDQENISLDLLYIRDIKALDKIFKLMFSVEYRSFGGLLGRLNSLEEKNVHDLAKWNKVLFNSMYAKLGLSNVNATEPLNQKNGSQKYLFDSGFFGEIFGNIPSNPTEEKDTKEKSSSHQIKYLDCRWVHDSQERKVPIVQFGKERYLMASLFINKDDLTPFLSVK
jgi:hypothetical protein